MPSSERLLILGATGQLGTDLVRAAAAAGVDHVGAAHEDIDVTRADSVAAGVARYRPTIVINTAALHRVDACKDDPHKAGLRAAVEPVPASTYYSQIRRPKNSALHTGRLASLLSAPPPSWRDALRTYLRQTGHLS